MYKKRELEEMKYEINIPVIRRTLDSTYVNDWNR